MGQESRVAANFLQSDARAIPFPAATFDAAIANHMLYHVPELPRALAEIRRALKPSGALYAATNGGAHLQELRAFLSEFLGIEQLFFEHQFSLENGAEHLGNFFASVQRVDFDNHLIVTETEPLVAYIISGFVGKQMIGAERVHALRETIAARIARDGAFRITKAVGLFIARTR